jgi:integrase
MRQRRRYQKGRVEKRRHGRFYVWVGRWRDVQGQRTRVLGRCAAMTKGDAEACLAAILRPINEGRGETAVIWKFRTFVEDVYFPFGRRTWKESSRSTTEPRINCHLFPRFGERLIQTITREQMQAFLEEKAGTCSRSTVDHLRWDLNAICKLAVSDGVMPFNAAAELRSPRRCQKVEVKRPLSEAEVLACLAPLELREKTMVRLAIFEGMRPGEILALRWDLIHAGFIVVQERVYKGGLDTPKNRKTRHIALSDGTAALLEELRAAALDASPGAFVFPSESDTPLSRDNVLRRYILPRLKDVGLGWVNFQVFRSTNATLMNKAGVDPKVGADQRGHGIGVSLDVYTKSDHEQKRAAVRRLERAIERARPKERRTA